MSYRIIADELLRQQTPCRLVVVCAVEAHVVDVAEHPRTLRHPDISCRERTWEARYIDSNIYNADLI